MSHGCSTCGRELARCEWCGESGLLAGGSGEVWPVTSQPEWDGNYHEPCYGAYQSVLKPG